MTKAEAIKELEKGNKLTHRSFTSDEWVKGNGIDEYIFEDGVRCSSHEFWRYRTDKTFNDGWIAAL